MTPEDARQIGREDAAVAIQIAREVPIAGTSDPQDLQLPYNWPESYRDSPEMPARRIASYWEDYLAWDRQAFLPENQPSVLVRFGQAGRIWTEAGDAEWAAYVETLSEEAQKADVWLFFTGSEVPYPELETTYWIWSVYVADLSRYERLPGMRLVSQEPVVIDERDLIDGLIPQGLSWLSRRRRKRSIG